MNTNEDTTSTKSVMNPAFGTILFCIITAVYYVYKPAVTIENVGTPDQVSSNSKSVFVYFLAVVFTQFVWNAYILSSTCGGSFNNYLGQAALYTFLPWTFFFGIVIMILNFAPSFKSAFSDIVGYYIVQSKANDILSTLLRGQGSPELEQKLMQSIKESQTEGQGVVDTTPLDTSSAIEMSVISPDPNKDAAERNIANMKPDNISKFAANTGAADLLKVFIDKNKEAPNKEPTVEAAGTNFVPSDSASATDKDAASDLVTKICGNASILINQLLPTNFSNFWDSFMNSSPPIFKEKYIQNPTGESTLALKKSLFDLVVQRDNVGESMWYIYTGILVSCIVQFQIASFNCKASK